MDELALTARGFPATPARPANDPDATVVIGLIGRIREVTRDALADMHAVSLDVELSPKGVQAKQVRIAERAVSLVGELAAAEASRAALQKRLDAAPVPGLDTIPSALFAPMLAVLQAMDPLERGVQVRQWMRDGDTTAAALLVNLPPALALVSKAEAAELKAELRTAANGPEAARAAVLQDAIRKLDDAAKAATGIIRDTAGMKVEGVPFKVPA